MHTKISWTTRTEDGVKREVRVQVSKQNLKWQFKRRDEERWDYDSDPTMADWDQLEDILRRRAGRGRAPGMVDAIQVMRRKAGY